MMTAGLQGDVGGGAPRLRTGLLQRIDLGMGRAGLHMPAFPHDLPAGDQHAAHPRIGLRGRDPAFSQPQRPGHVARIIGLRHGISSPATDGFASGSRDIWRSGVASAGATASCKRSTSSRNAFTSWKLRYTEANRT